MSALAPVPRSSESDSKQRGSPAPAAVCGTNCLTDRDQHYRRRSEAQPCSVHKVMRTGYRKAFSMSNIGALMNLRSLMVMLCILSVSCRADDFLETISPRFQDLKEKDFNERKNNALTVNFWENMTKSASFYWCLLLIGVMIAAMFVPVDGFHLFNGDTGGSLILRLAILIPGFALVTRAGFSNYHRNEMMKESATCEIYNDKVRRSEDGLTTVKIMTAVMFVTIIVICSVASTNPADFGKWQVWGSLVLLGLLTISGSVWGFMEHTALRKAAPEVQRSTPFYSFGHRYEPEAAAPEEGTRRRLAQILNRL